MRCIDSACGTFARQVSAESACREEHAEHVHMEKDHVGCEAPESSGSEVVGDGEAGSAKEIPRETGGTRRPARNPSKKSTPEDGSQGDRRRARPRGPEEEAGARMLRLRLLLGYPNRTRCIIIRVSSILHISNLFNVHNNTSFNDSLPIKSRRSQFGLSFDFASMHHVEYGGGVVSLRLFPHHTRAPCAHAQL